MRTRFSPSRCCCEEGWPCPPLCGGSTGIDPDTLTYSSGPLGSLTLHKRTGAGGYPNFCEYVGFYNLDWTPGGSLDVSDGYDLVVHFSGAGGVLTITAAVDSSWPKSKYGSCWAYDLGERPGWDGFVTGSTGLRKFQTASDTFSQIAPAGVVLAHLIHGDVLLIGAAPRTVSWACPGGGASVYSRANSHRQITGCGLGTNPDPDPATAATTAQLFWGATTSPYFVEHTISSP